MSQRIAEGNWPEGGLETVAACPVCGETGSGSLYEGLRDRAFGCAPGEWTLLKCDKCGVAYLNPRPNAETIGLAYTSYYTHDVVPRAEVAPDKGRKRRRIAARNGYINAKYGYDLKPADGKGRWMLASTRAGAERWIRHLPFESDGHLLDVGCGNGHFLAEMRAAGWNVTGIDPDEKAVTTARAAGLEVRLGELDEDTFPPESFDAITLSHVIEHVFDPLNTLQLCARFLKPGGTVWLATPNLESKGHEIFGINWFALDPPRHLVIFTPKALRDTLRKAGLEVLPPPLHSWNARGNFLASGAVAEGVDPIHPPQLKDGGRIKRLAHAANRLSLRDPDRAEEILLMARKPMKGTS